MNDAKPKRLVRDPGAQLIRDRSLRKLFQNPASRSKLYPFIGRELET